MRRKRAGRAVICCSLDPYTEYGNVEREETRGREEEGGKKGGKKKGQGLGFSYLLLAA